MGSWFFLSTLIAVQTPNPAITPAQADFFESKIRPLIMEQCVRCHGASKQLGGLRLDSREAILKGGGRGSALTQVRPQESLLLRAVQGQPGAPAMPPGAPLKPKQIAELTQWVKMGAPWPDDSKPGGGNLWSAQPVKRATPPSNVSARWRTNPIDAFVYSQLKKKGLVPAPPADRRTLIRRLTFDLTGLPPTPLELDAFLADNRPAAYERLVDRLLASPRYGERWARYWLDLVRYADTNGYERDAEKPNSWKYRDYVINSLNRDKPYNRFILEQLAGDELPDANEETWTATGFLRLGTWDDEPNDPDEYTYDRLDDLVHSTTTAFLSLTVKCARCHDHKFDAIPQREYYELAAHFWPGHLRPAARELIGGPPANRLKYPVLAFTNEPAAEPLRVLEKGDFRKPKEAVTPGGLSLAGLAEEASTKPLRIRLAEWIASEKNPYTARVAVNRLWQGHFGRGLVSTVDNFGRKGSLPTHPELLDWLASEFVRQGWRAKPLHRMIMLSETYKQSSNNPRESQQEQKDALNEFLWKYPRRRLDADALRDSILVVSGQLNPAMGGRGFTPFVAREALEGLSRKGAEWAVSPAAEQNRRSIYLFLKRALIPPFMTVFDFGDTTSPLAQRDVSISPTQALSLLNNEFMQSQAEAFARRVEESGRTLAEQITTAWRLAAGRPPTQSELAGAVKHVNTMKPESANTVKELQVKDSLSLWLRGDRVQTDAANRVLKWEDASGQGRHAQPISPERGPTLAKTGVQGAQPQPALQFSGREFLDLSGQPVSGQQFTLVAVASDQGKEGHREIISNWRRKDNIGTALFLGTTGNGLVRVSDAFAPAGKLSDPGSLHVLSAVSAPGSVESFQNRGVLASIAASLAPRKVDGPWVIGTQGDIDGEYWQGQIAEVLVWDRALTPEELASVWDYLSTRYGIAQRPPQAHPGLVSLCRVLMNLNEFVFVD